MDELERLTCDHLAGTHHLEHKRVVVGIDLASEASARREDRGHARPSISSADRFATRRESRGSRRGRTGPAAEGSSASISFRSWFTRSGGRGLESSGREARKL